MNNAVGAKRLDQIENAGPVADVDRVVDVIPQRLFKTLLVPRSIPFRTKKLPALIVVQSMDFEAAFVEGLTDFRTD